MERKQEEQARQMQELQAHAKSLQHVNDKLRSQVEKTSNLERMYEKAIVLNIQQSAIKENSPLFLTMMMPQQMMNFPPGGPYPRVLHHE